MDSTNLENVRNAVKEMSKNNVKRNSWILVRAYDKPVKSNHRGKNSRKLNKLANQNAKKVVSPNSGYIVWKDRKVVIIYTNDLLKTPKNIFFTVLMNRTILMVENVSEDFLQSKDGEKKII